MKTYKFKNRDEKKECEYLLMYHMRTYHRSMHAYVTRKVNTYYKTSRTIKNDETE